MDKTSKKTCLLGKTGNGACLICPAYRLCKEAKNKQKKQKSFEKARS